MAGDPYTKHGPKQRLFNLLRALGIHRVPKYLVNHLPAPLQRQAIRLGAKPELVPAAELTARYKDVIQRLLPETPRLGDYLEFGVFQGTSLACMYEASAMMGQRHMRLIGFDSFEGLPPTAAEDDGGVWEPGTFRSSLQYTRTYLDMKGVDWSRVILVKGWFNETLNDATIQAHGIESASIVMVDCDMYSSAKESLDFVAPLLADPAVIFFDDWYSYKLDEQNMGEKRAFTEFLAEHPQFTATELFDFGGAGKAFEVRRG